MPRKRKGSGSRKIEVRLLIFCEGEKDKSESAYFKAFIQSCRFSGKKVEVKVVDCKKNNGTGLVREAQKSREFPEDILWVVYDQDGYTEHAKTFQQAKNTGVKIGFSAISFETWILLHYEYTTRAFKNSGEVIRHLQKNHGVDYSKSSQNVFAVTQSRLNIAKQHAVRIQKQQRRDYPDKPVYLINPYTNLNQLIEEIERLQNL